jgi:hypothetical protein
MQDLVFCFVRHCFLQVEFAPLLAVALISLIQTE